MAYSAVGKRVLITGAALASDRFEHYLPDMKAVVDAKNADIDAYIAGAAAMAPR